MVITICRYTMEGPIHICVPMLVHHLTSLPGTPSGIAVERERLDKIGRPLLGSATEPADALGWVLGPYGRILMSPSRSE